MPFRYIYPGGCHCHNVAIRLHSDKTPSELPLRSDSCSFCNKHRAVYTSDPRGEVFVEIGDANLLTRYRFGTRTADFLICKACGVFVAAYMPEPSLAVVNANVLDARTDFLANDLGVVDLDGESLDARLARRRARWTPVGLLVGAAAPLP